jgi:hypothetical protein
MLTGLSCRIRFERTPMSPKAALLAGAFAVGFGGLSLALPAPAWADQDFSGTYAYFVTEEVDRGAAVEINTLRTWTVTPCGPGCAHVSSAPQAGTGGSGAYDGDLRLIDGAWRMTVARPDLSVCNDGRSLPGTVSYSVDPVTLTGTANGTVAADCDGAPGGFQDTFTLNHPAAA